MKAYDWNHLLSMFIGQICPHNHAQQVISAIRFHRKDPSKFCPWSNIVKCNSYAKIQTCEFDFGKLYTPSLIHPDMYKTWWLTQCFYPTGLCSLQDGSRNGTAESELLKVANWSDSSARCLHISKYMKSKYFIYLCNRHTETALRFCLIFCLLLYTQQNCAYLIRILNLLSWC